MDFAVQLIEAREITLARRLLEALPREPRAAYLLGEYWRREADWARALECYERALRLDPYNRQAAANLGHLYEKLLADKGGDDDGLRAHAVEAWRRRLLICRDTAASQKAALDHLEKLGASKSQLEEWLEHGQLA